MVKKRIDNFVYNDENVIGKGQFGYVYQGYDVRTNEVVAIKVIPVSILENKFFEYLLINEIGALKKLNTPYIVRFIDLKLTMHNIYLITEFCNGGDLSGLLTKKGRLNEDEVCDILWQIAEAFKQMKEFHMLHRDLKPPNILLNEGKVKIADLGFSKTVENFQVSINNSTVGSPIYMSPQVLFKQTYTSKCDIWSLGIVLYQLFYGKVPWHALDIVELANKIKNEPIIFQAGIPISPELKDFIVRCLRYEESERIGWDELFDHPAVKKSKYGQEEERKQKGGAMAVEKSPDVQEISKKEATNGNNTTSQMVDEAELAKLKAQSIYEDPVNKKPLTTVIRPEEVNKAPVATPVQDEAVYTRKVKDRDNVTSNDVIPDPKAGGGQPGGRGAGGQRGGGGYQPGPGMGAMGGMPGMYPGMQPGWGMGMPGQMPGQPGMGGHGMGMGGQPGMGMPGMGMGGFPPGYGGGPQQPQMPGNQGWGGQNMGPGGPGGYGMGQQMPQQGMGQGQGQGRGGQQPGMYPPYGGQQQQGYYGGGGMPPNGWGPYQR